MREGLYSCEYPGCDETFIQPAQLMLHAETHTTYQNPFSLNSGQFGPDVSQPHDVIAARQFEKFALDHRAYVADDIHCHGQMAFGDTSSNKKISAYPFSGAPTAPSSVDSSNSWRHHSWTASTPSTSCYESGENVPSFSSFTRTMQPNPNTPPDSAFGSYTEQYQPSPPPHRDGGMYPPSAHDTLADSGVSSTGPSRPASPSAPPTTSGFERDSGTEGRSATCTNCFTQTTPLWRINPEGQLLCNACGLFFRLYGVVRPPSLKTDLIKKRNRDTFPFSVQRSYDGVSPKRFTSPCTFVESHSGTFSLI